MRGAPGRELSLGALATAANPIRYAYGKEASQAALRLVKPRAGAVLEPGEWRLPGRGAGGAAWHAWDRYAAGAVGHTETEN